MKVRRAWVAHRVRPTFYVIVLSRKQYPGSSLRLLIRVSGLTVGKFPRIQIVVYLLVILREEPGRGVDDTIRDTHLGSCNPDKHAFVAPQWSYPCLSLNEWESSGWPLPKPKSRDPAPHPLEIVASSGKIVPDSTESHLDFVGVGLAGRDDGHSLEPLSVLLCDSADGVRRA